MEEGSHEEINGTNVLPVCVIAGCVHKIWEASNDDSNDNDLTSGDKDDATTATEEVSDEDFSRRVMIPVPATISRVVKMH